MIRWHPAHAPNMAEHPRRHHGSTLKFSSNFPEIQ
jgi:hypothetical protein